MEFINNLLNSDPNAKLLAGFFLGAVVLMIATSIAKKKRDALFDEKISALKHENTELAAKNDNFDRELALARASQLVESTEARAQEIAKVAAEAHAPVAAPVQADVLKLVTNEVPTSVVEAAHTVEHETSAPSEPVKLWALEEVKEVSLHSLLVDSGLHAGSDYELAAGGVKVSPKDGAGFAIDAEFPVELFRDAISTPAGSLRTAKFDAHAAIVKRHMESVAKAGNYPYTYVPHAEFINAAYAADADLADHVRGLGIAVLTPDSAGDLFKHVHAVNHPKAPEAPKVDTEVLVNHLEVLGAKLREATNALDSAVGSIKGSTPNNSDRVSGL